jgi:hypothetical protein
VRARVTAEQRSTWHGRIASALQRRSDADPEALCTHWHGAGHPARAAEYALVAADRANAALAFDHAVRLYRMALELGSPAPQLAKQIRIKIAEALVSGGRSAEAAAVYLELAGDDHTLETFDFRRRAAEEYMCSGHFNEGELVLNEVLGSIRVSLPKSTGASLASALYHRLALRLGGLDFVRRELPECPEASVRLVDALCSAASAYAMIDPFRGASFHARHVRAALRLGEPFRVSRALSMFTINVAAGGGPKREQAAAQCARGTEVLAQQPPHPFLQALHHGMVGFCHYFVGEWDRAKVELAASEKLFREQCVGASYELRVVQLILCRTEVFQGDLASLAKHVHDYVREAEEKTDHYASLALLASATYLLAVAADDLPAAERYLDTAEARLSSDRFQLTHFYCEAARMQLDLYRGNGAAAHARWLDVWPKAKKNMLFFVESTHVVSREHRGRAALAAATQGEQADAKLLAQVDADIRALDKFKLPWASALGALLRGGVATARGDSQAAVAGMTAAVAALEACGMHLHAEAARFRLGQLTGGDAGAQHIAQATARMQRQGIREPERMAAMLAPARLR